MGTLGELGDSKEADELWGIRIGELKRPVTKPCFLNSSSGSVSKPILFGLGLL